MELSKSASLIASRASFSSVAAVSVQKLGRNEHRYSENMSPRLDRTSLQNLHTKWNLGRLS